MLQLIRKGLKSLLSGLQKLIKHILDKIRSVKRPQIIKSLTRRFLPGAYRRCPSLTITDAVASLACLYIRFGRIRTLISAVCLGFMKSKVDNVLVPMLTLICTAILLIGHPHLFAVWFIIDTVVAGMVLANTQPEPA